MEESESLQDLCLKRNNAVPPISAEVALGHILLIVCYLEFTFIWLFHVHIEYEVVR